MTWALDLFFILSMLSFPSIMRFYILIGRKPDVQGWGPVRLHKIMAAFPYALSVAAGASIAAAFYSDGLPRWIFSISAIALGAIDLGFALAANHSRTVEDLRKH